MNIGTIVEKECAICKAPTLQRFDGATVSVEDVLLIPSLEKYINLDNYTCQKCHGTFSYIREK